MVSTGISKADMEKTEEILNNIPAKFICIDVANGYSEHFTNFVKSVKNSNVIDVRTNNEYKNANFKTSQNIPLNTIQSEIDNISDNSYVFCAGGYRSVIACSILMKAGKKDLINVLEGYSGINKHIESQL